MFSALLLSLREGLEAALIIGIVLAALKKIKRADLRAWAWYGVLAAALFSLAASFLLDRLGLSFQGKAEQIFEGLAMLSAAALLTWMILWMQRHSASLKTELEAQTAQAASGKDKAAIFSLIFFAVFREGLELSLFLLAARLAVSGKDTTLGALLGLALAAVLGWIIFSLSSRLSLQRFFQVTNFLLILFAAGLVGLAVHELNEAGWIPELIDHTWDLTSVLNEESTLGGILKALFGYQSSPSLSAVVGYLLYFVSLGTRILFPQKSTRK
jgi:high-affinity iron transporter